MSTNYLNNIYSQFIYISRYARYLDSENRRETWSETIARYFNFYIEYIKENYGYKVTKEERKQLEEAVLSLKVVPSMRGLMTAGPALKRDSMAQFNCAYLPIDSIKAFDEILHTLMCGTGVGFSVETDQVNQLPIVADELHDSDTTIVVDDSRLGWAKALRELISLLYSGHIPRWDISRLRPAGARLKTFGGRSSGPGPLIDLFKFVVALFKRAKGRKLTSTECHDLVCKIAETVIVGGVRRSALISLSDLTDDRMRDAKTGAWWTNHPQRRLSNNSAVYESKPEPGQFIREWLSLYESKSGERGIFSRLAAKKVIDNSNAFRKEFFGEDARFREYHSGIGVNPCSEILLRPYETCNLTEVIVRETDSLEELMKKVELATILGTIQSALDDFKYINKKWQRNVQEERLLGVSLTGIFDHPVLNGNSDRETLIDWLEGLKIVAIRTNIEWAKKLGINSSVAITCVKPSGTTSALTGTSSGIHAAHAPYYIRHVRNDLKDPLTRFMMDVGFPWEQDAYDPSNMCCFKFPIKAAETAVFRKDLSAIAHLELWKIYQQYYCEHKPSITVSVKEHEWLTVGAWVYDNFEWVSGVAFLPSEEDAHSYVQAPFVDATKEEYETLSKEMPVGVEWNDLKEYEKEDSTTNLQILACTGAEGCLL